MGENEEMWTVRSGPRRRPKSSGVPRTTESCRDRTVTVQVQVETNYRPRNRASDDIGAADRVPTICRPRTMHKHCPGNNLLVTRLPFQPSPRGPTSYDRSRLPSRPSPRGPTSRDRSRLPSRPSPRGPTSRGRKRSRNSREEKYGTQPDRKSNVGLFI